MVFDKGASHHLNPDLHIETFILFRQVSFSN
jgi:hypothetical protein